MQLADEQVEYLYQGLLVSPAEAWTPLAELQSQHYLCPSRIRAIQPQVMQVRGQIAAEREMMSPPPELQPLDAGFIDLPQKFLDDYRRKAEKSELGQIMRLASRLRDVADRVIVLGIGGSYLGARAL